MVPARSEGASAAQACEMLKALLCSSQAQRSEMDRAVVLAHVPDQEAQLDEERRGRVEAVNTAGRLVTELQEHILKHETHTAQATVAFQSLQGQLQATQSELQRVQVETRQQIDTVVKEAEARHHVALQAEQARVTQLALENQRQVSFRAELEQQRVVCQSESVAFHRAYEVFEQNSEAGDKQLVQEFETRALEAQVSVGKRESEADGRAAQEAKLQQELSASEAKAQQTHAAEAAKLSEWSREVDSEKNSLLQARQRTLDAETKLAEGADRLATLVKMCRDFENEQAVTGDEQEER
jgi:hypothetical protein